MRKLKCQADPELYDLPLTLLTRVPADWKRVGVTLARLIKKRG